METMDKITEGQIISFTRDIDVQTEDAWTTRIVEGDPVEVVAIWHDNNDGTLNVEVKADNALFFNPWDRTGCNDQEGPVASLVFDLDLEDVASEE